LYSIDSVGLFFTITDINLVHLHFITSILVVANVTGLILYLRFGGTASNGARGNIFEEPVWGENVCILRYKMAYSGALF